MPSLKDLRLRIKSVKATQKITSAMKMVAAAKLRKAQEKAEASRPYAANMKALLSRVLNEQRQEPNLPVMFTGNQDSKVHLLIVATSDRGLCGGFNTSIVKEARAFIRQQSLEGYEVKIFCLGRKARELLRRDFDGSIIGTEIDIAKRGLTFAQSSEMAQTFIKMLNSGEIGKISAIYSVFKSVISQEVTQQQLVPLVAKNEDQDHSIYEFEPSAAELLEALLEKNFATQIYQILIETNASEHGARMTAMDNATRNARDVIRKLELNYNRTRQSVITRELIEIISGAEAL